MQVSKANNMIRVLYCIEGRKAFFIHAFIEQFKKIVFQMNIGYENRFTGAAIAS